MKDYYFYRTIRKSTIQFLNMFSEIDIARYNTSGTITGYHRVPLKYGPKAKMYYWLHEQNSDGTPKHDIQLPIMGVSMTAMTFDPLRMPNMFDSIKVSTDLTTRTISKYLNPTPYTLSFDLSIWSKYMVDIDQICEQILPYFQPHAFTRISINELDTTVENKIILQSCAPETEAQYGEEDWRDVRWTLGFDVQTYIFKPLETTPIVREIFTNLYTSETAFDARDTTSPYSSGAPGDTESMSLSGTGYDDDGNILYNYEIF